MAQQAARVMGRADRRKTSSTGPSASDGTRATPPPRCLHRSTGEALDRYTVRFTLKSRCVAARHVSNPMALPIIARECVEKFGDLKKAEPWSDGPLDAGRYDQTSLEARAEPGLLLPACLYRPRHTPGRRGQRVADVRVPRGGTIWREFPGIKPKRLAPDQGQRHEARRCRPRVPKRNAGSTCAPTGRRSATCACGAHVARRQPPEDHRLGPRGRRRLQPPVPAALRIGAAHGPARRGGEVLPP